MYSILSQFAAEETSHSKDLFGSLGIDLTALIINTVAFLVLMWFLSKYVYPALSKSLDKREASIEAANKAAVEAEKSAANAQAETKALLDKARRQAADIVSTAKTEAGSIVAKSEEKSKAQAEHIVAEARDSIQKEVLAAKKALHNETIDLVAAATQKVVGNAVTASVDEKVIRAALKENA